MAGPDPPEPPARAFIHALRDLGWIDGHTVVVERRSAEGEPANAPAIFGELVVRRADVIVVAGAPWLLRAVRRATPDIPIVSLFQDEPATAGQIIGFGSPGGNLTGLTLAESSHLSCRP
jgi:putative ABC transport system substrate-binding protein